MIVHIITDFSASAGAETMLARLLRISEDDRTIVAPLIGVSERNRYLASNPRVEYRPQGVQSPVQLVRAIYGLARLIREERPKIVLCWMYHAMVVGTLAALLARTRTPVYWNVRQSLDDPASLTRSTRLAVRLGRSLSARPAGIIFNSARALELHKEFGYRNKNSIVIPNGFDLPKAGVVAARRAQVLGIAGRFHPQKDHATFFRAAAQTVQTHPDARFVAAGLGLTSDNSAIASLIKAAGLRSDKVELRGELRDMGSFYREIDALVLSSRTEGFPNVVAEAMSYGKPVITTDVGDAAVVVGDTGFIVAPRDPEALAAAMRALLDLAPSSYATLADAARRRVEAEYALPRVADKYRRFLET